METAEQTIHEWVLDRLDWHGADRGEGHDSTCWRRHPACAREYVEQLQTVIMVLDSALWRAEHNDL